MAKRRGPNNKRFESLAIRQPARDVGQPPKLNIWTCTEHGKEVRFFLGFSEETRFDCPDSRLLGKGESVSLSMTTMLACLLVGIIIIIIIIGSPHHHEVVEDTISD